MKFFKKNTEENRDENVVTSSFLYGVYDIFQTDTNGVFLVIGKVTGTANSGDAFYIVNPGEDDEEMLLTTIDSIEINKQRVQQATNCLAAFKINIGNNKSIIRRGTIFFTKDQSMEAVHKKYVDTLGDVFILQKKLMLDDKEWAQLTIADCAEILRLAQWFDNKVQPNSIEKEKFDKLIDWLCKKIINAKEIYCLMNKDTGEAHMFSRVISYPDGKYECSSPSILVFTKSYIPAIENAFTKDKFDIKKIQNTENNKEIYNFLGNAFYLNGACNVQVCSQDVEIKRERLVPAPDYSNLPKVNIPVTNPNLVRWLLLIGQLDKVESEKEKLVYSLYYDFMCKELLKAEFLIPMKKIKDIESEDGNNNVTFNKDITIELAMMKGKNNRLAVKMYTDWKRMSLEFDKKEYSGIIQNIADVINKYDCVINVTEHYKAGCYVSKEMFENIK